MPKKPESKSFLFPLGKTLCANCGKKLPFKASTSLLKLAPQNISITPEIMKSIIESILSRIVYKKQIKHKPTIEKIIRTKNNKSYIVSTDIACRCTCNEYSITLLWVEVEHGTWIGPWCRMCFKHNEYQVFGDTPCNVRVLSISTKEILKLIPVSETTGNTQEYKHEIALHTCTTSSLPTTPSTPHSCDLEGYRDDSPETGDEGLLF